MLRTSLAERLPEYQRRWWRPPEKITIPDWVEKHVRLPRFTAAEPGPLRISRTPYTRGPLLSLGSPFIEQIVLVWGRQLGKSQGVQYPFLCYCIAEDQGPAICLLPTIDKAKYTAKKRLQPMFNQCEAVRREKTDNPDDFTMMEMQFKGMILSMAWGGSEMQLTTRPARYLFRDEVDELKKTVGQNAVDPMKAIEQTTSNFANRKIVDTGTPTTPEGNIWQELKTCQYVFEYWVPCPHCGAFQVLYWENVRFGENHDPVVVEENAYYECEVCHETISNLDKIRILAGGEWRARNSPDPCDQILKNVRAKIEETISLDDILKNRRVKKIGFHLPKWYSPFSGGTFGVIAKEFLEANKALKDGEDFAPMRNWTIYNAALPHQEMAISAQEHELEKNKIDLPEFVFPKDTIAVTCGIDPGQKGFWFASIAWKWDMTPHLLHYGFLSGNYEDSGINDLLTWTYREQDSNRSIGVWRTGIDTGGGEYSDKDATMTEEAYQWIRVHRNEHKGLVGTKGMSHQSDHRVRFSKIEKMPDGKLIPGGIILLEINTDEMKDSIWFHLNIEEGKPGRFTFHSNTGFDLMRHLTGEEKVFDIKKNKYQWVRRRANHLLDCVVIAFALADPQCQGGVKVLQQNRGGVGGQGRRVISKGVE